MYSSLALRLSLLPSNIRYSLLHFYSAVGQWFYLHNAQGKTRTLGSFADARSAALAYDAEATKAGAALNFPPGCNSGLTSTAAEGPAPAPPGGGELGEEGPDTNVPLPVGNAGGEVAASTGTLALGESSAKVSLTDCAAMSRIAAGISSCPV